ALGVADEETKQFRDVLSVSAPCTAADALVVFAPLVAQEEKETNQPDQNQNHDDKERRTSNKIHRCSFPFRRRGAPNGACENPAHLLGADIDIAVAYFPTDKEVWEKVLLSLAGESKRSVVQFFFFFSSAPLAPGRL